MRVSSSTLISWAVAVLLLAAIGLLDQADALGQPPNRQADEAVIRRAASVHWRRQGRLLGSTSIAVVAPSPSGAPAAAAPTSSKKKPDYVVAIVVGIVVLLALVGLVVAGAFLLGKRGGRLDAMRADAAAGALIDDELDDELDQTLNIAERIKSAREKAHDSRGMDVMGTLDLSIQGWFINPDDIEICKRDDGSDWLLGAGSYGKVYKAVRGGVQDVAVKIMHEADDEQLAQFEKEIGILKSISYDRNIVQFYGASMVNREPMLLLEFCEGGDLRTALDVDNRHKADDLPRQLSWFHEGQYIAQDVARGLYFLHNIDIVHGDLKTLNILLTRNWAVAKLGDVGVARYLKAKDVPDHVALGTFVYSAPEMLIGNDSGVKADIYSMGVVLWEIVTGGIAKRGRLHDPKVPEECPQDVADLIKDCMKSVPEDRPTTREIFTRLRRCSMPRENGGKLGGSYPSHGSGSTGEGGSLPQTQPPVTPHLSEQLPRRAQSTPNLSEDIASGSQPAAAAAAQLPRADSSLAGLGARMRSSSQHEKKSATAGISARSRSSAGSLPGLATPAAAAAAAAAAASLSSSPSGSGGVQQNGSLGRAGSGMLKPIQSGVQHPSEEVLPAGQKNQRGGKGGRPPSSAPASAASSRAPSAHNSMDSVASGGSAPPGANPCSFLFPGADAAAAPDAAAPPAQPAAGPQPFNPYLGTFDVAEEAGRPALNRGIGAAASKEGCSEAPPNVFASPAALAPQTKSENSSPYAFALGPPPEAQAAGPAEASNPYASFTGAHSAPPTAASSPRRPQAPANPYAVFGASGSPPRGSSLPSSEVSPCAAFAGAASRDGGRGGDGSPERQLSSSEQAKESVRELASAVQDYRAANRAAEVAAANGVGAANPFDNVPAGTDWRDVAAAAVNGPTGAGRAKSASRMSVSRTSRQLSAGPRSIERGPGSGSIGGSSRQEVLEPSRLASAPGTPVKQHSASSTGRLSSSAAGSPSLGNLDDMYTRFITAPADIARARCSNSSASSDVADPIKAAHAEAAAAAADNPYAAFAGISEAGLQSSIFHAPALVVDPKPGQKSMSHTSSGSSPFGGQTPAEVLQGAASTEGRLARQSTKRSSAPARPSMDGPPPADNPYGLFAGLEDADESYTPAEVVAERNPSAPAFRRGRMPPATPFAAPPAAAAAEPDNPYSMFLGGGAAAAPSAQLSKLPSLQYGALADEVGMGSRNWFKLQKAKVPAAEKQADAELDLLMRDLSGYDKPSKSKIYGAKLR